MPLVSRTPASKRWDAEGIPYIYPFYQCIPIEKSRDLWSIKCNYTKNTVNTSYSVIRTTLKFYTTPPISAQVNLNLTEVTYQISSLGSTPPHSPTPPPPPPKKKNQLYFAKH